MRRWRHRAHKHSHDHIPMIMFLLVVAAIVVLIVFAVRYASAQQTAREITVPPSPAESTLERTAKSIRDKRQAIGDALQQSRYELDKANKPLLAKIQKLQDQMELNRERVQNRFNDVAKQKQKEALIDQAQIPWLEVEVRQSAKLPADAHFDVETGKWTVPK